MSTEQPVNEALSADLRKGMLFARLAPEQLQRVAARARRMRLQEGQSLFEQGDAAERFYLVLSGHIKLFRLSPEGNEKVIEVVSPGSTFAEALMFLDRPQFPVSAVALSDVGLISIDARDFAAMLRGSVETCFLLLGDMSQRLRGLIREIDNLSLQSATARVAGYLLKRAPAGEHHFELEVPKGVVASRLSVKPETFSRIIKSLSTRGLLVIKGSRVEVLDRDGLERVADVSALDPDALEDTFLYPCPPAGKA
ncbi:MAG: Crp/Fnr family transcriptional regulator [Chromatiales bacterium]|jgi:CRP-like cAMP-binding protein